MSQTRTEVVVIGAGPAGLAFAGAFAPGRCIVLERGPTAGDSWRRMPRDMRLNSGWGASRLPGAPSAPWSWASRVSRSAYHSHLVAFSQRAGIEVRTGIAVERVTRSEDGFRVETPGGTFRSRFVVNATGYFGNPVVPDYPGLAGSSVPQLTVPDYESVDAVGDRLGGGSRIGASRR